MNEQSDRLSFLRAALDQRVEEGRLRGLRAYEPDLAAPYVQLNNKKLINFCSNDYLGLTTHPEVIDRSVFYIKKYGAGSGASRLVSGTLTIHEQLEKKLVNTFEVEAVLLFNSGFQANISLLPALVDRNSLILADRKSHNSLLQGALLSNAELKRFRHNDYGHLEELLIKSKKGDYNRVWIVSETVFSMDGDQSEVDKLIYLANKYDALLYSDDAHALGVLGPKGLGLNYKKEDITLSMGTFGKAFGSFGAFVGCSKLMKKYLVNFCSGFIYTTALPPGVMGAIDAALDLIPRMETERKILLENVRYLKSSLTKLGYNLGTSASQIIPVIIGSENETVDLSNYLETKGFWASSIRPPTVEKGASRVRLTLTAKHTKTQIDDLIKAFKEWKNK